MKKTSPAACRLSTRAAGLVLGVLFAAAWALQGTPSANAAKPDLVDATTVVPDLVLDMRYATENNFLKVKLYKTGRCLLRPDTAAALARAADILRAKGYRIRAWDCYRPHAVQRRMWEAYPVKGYVAPPAPGSVHNRGGAVDISLSTLDGKDVEMPTDFDDFTTRANLHGKVRKPEHAERRQLLRDAMEAAGFTGIRSEWWHFEGPGARRHPVLDIPLEEFP